MTPCPSVLLGKWQPPHSFHCSLWYSWHMSFTSVIAPVLPEQRDVKGTTALSPQKHLFREPTLTFTVSWSLGFYSNHVCCKTTAPTRSWEPQVLHTDHRSWLQPALTLHWTWFYSHNCKNYELNYSDCLFYLVRRRNWCKML